MKLLERNGLFIDEETGEVLSAEQVELYRRTEVAAKAYRAKEQAQETLNALSAQIQALIKEQFPQLAELENTLHMLKNTYDKAQEALREQALVVYQAQMLPSQKTFGAVTIRLNQRVTHWDEGMAVAYAEEMNRPELTKKVADKKKFETLAKAGVVPAEVMKVGWVHETAIKESALAEIGYSTASEGTHD